MVTAFTSPTYLVQAPTCLRPARNAWDYEQTVETHGEGRVYRPETNDVNAWMGAIAQAVVEWLGRALGDHALNSFAAVGPRASDLVEPQEPMEVYAPLEVLVNAGGVRWQADLCWPSLERA